MRLAWFAAAALVGLCACTDRARMYPMDEAAIRMGTVTVDFVRQGMGHGPVTMTMPDGEVLQGEYQITENAAVGMGFSGLRSSTAVAFGSGRRVVISAVGGRGTISNCEGTVDIGGHGSGICDIRGAKFRMMF